MSEYEKQQIKYEAAKNEAMDNFFEARKQLIRDRDTEFLFESGFRMAWNTRTSGWQSIETAPKDGSHVRLYRFSIQFVGYYATGLRKWIINAPGLPVMEPPPQEWKPLDWPDEQN